MGPRLFRHGKSIQHPRDFEICLVAMGPRLFRHGKEKLYVNEYEIDRLQWGHAFSGMGSIAAIKDGLNRYKLQWGHAFSGMGSTMLDAVTVQPTELQWGHAFSGMGSRKLRIRYLRCPGCNGATPFQAWEEPVCLDLTQRNTLYRVIRILNHGLATAMYSIVNVRAQLTLGILRAVPS